MSQNPPLQPPPRIKPEPGQDRASPAPQSRSTPRPWVVGLLVLLGVCLVVVIVVLPRLVDGRTEMRTPDSVTEIVDPSASPTTTPLPPTPPRPSDHGVRRTVNTALEEGRAALADGDATAAIAAFRRAVALEPGNTAAENGLRRAEVLAEVQTLETAALAHEERHEKKAATRAARRVLELEPNSEIARGVIRRAATAAEKANYRDLVTRGLAALEARQYQSALDAFSSAAEHEPAAPEVIDGLTRARAGLKQDAVNRHLALATEAEKAENWALGVGEYRSILALEPSSAVAQDGEARSSERLELTRRIEFHLANPNRLATTEVLEEAADLIAEAQAVTPRGPRFSNLIDRLDRLVVETSIPVPVVLESDGLTDVVVFRVGEFGTFDRQTIELRPGTYTVVGRREGFRDVRLVIKIGPGQSPPTVKVFCTEAI